jgi:integrase
LNGTVHPAIVAPITLILRGTIWYLKRRVPQRFAPVEPRPSVWISLKTDSRREADRRAEEAWREALVCWEAALVVATGDGESRYIAAQTVAKQRRFTFLPVE